MRFLFLHPNFPAQFYQVAVELAKDPANQVVFGTMRQDGNIAGVAKVLYQEAREVQPQTHRYVRPLEGAVIQGQGAYRSFLNLKSQGFYPDVIMAHSGWGPGLFMKDLFPQAKLYGYFEWFYHAHGADVGFDPNEQPDADDEARIRIKNAPILIDLYTCDRGLSPTSWQHQQFPPEFRAKLTVRHDGVDTNFFQPSPGAKLVLPAINLDLSQVDELITYVARGMEPYRGFPQFMAAISILQKRRPQCHAVIVGDDRVAYGKPLPDGKSYKQLMLETLELDHSRLHFTGLLPYGQYLQVIQASSVHVYLTRPFVLSWSMLESMSAGCLILGSRTPPVEEVIVDGENGLLVDFFSPEAIADRIEAVLEHPDRMAQIRQNARQTILERYDLATLLPQHLAWLQGEM